MPSVNASNADAPLRQPSARLGQILIAEGLISEKQLQEALARREKEGGFLGQSLIELNFIDQRTLTLLLVKQCKIPHLNLLDYQVSDSIVSLVPRELCERYNVLPIDTMGRMLTLAMVDPLDVEALEAVRQAVPELRIKPILCDWQHFQAVSTRFFGKPGAHAKADVSPKPPLPEPRPAPATAVTESTAVVETPKRPELPSRQESNAPTPVPAQSTSPSSPAPGWTLALQQSLQEAVTNALTGMGRASSGLSVDELTDVLRRSVAEGLADSVQSRRQESTSVSDPQAGMEALSATLARIGDSLDALRSATEQTAARDLPSPRFDGDASSSPASSLDQNVERLSAVVQRLTDAAEADRTSHAEQSRLSHETVERIATDLGNLGNHFRDASTSAPVTPLPDVTEALRQGIQDSLSGLKNELAALANASPRGTGDTDEKLGRMAEAIARMAEASEVLHAARKTEEETVTENARRDRESAETRIRRGVGRISSPPKTLNATEPDADLIEIIESGASLLGYTFDDFVTGPANEFTLSMCKAVAATPGGENNPFFICGEVGLGKTHLVNAIGNDIVMNNPERRVGYASSSRFAGHLAEAIAVGVVDQFRDSYAHWDVLILDDIQFLGGRIEAQEEFFHVFNALNQQGRQIIIAGDRPPEKLGLLEQRLVSRFAGGMVAYVRPPEWDTRLEILRQCARRSDVKLPTEVAALLAMRIPSDVRKLMGAFRKVVAFSRVKSEDVSCEMVGRILSELGIDEVA